MYLDKQFNTQLTSFVIQIETVTAVCHNEKLNVILKN